MFKRIFKSIFSTMDTNEVMNKMDDWKLTSEETVKYQLEWIKALPTGFQIAQRFIGISFCVVFLLMALISFVMLAFGLDIMELKGFMTETMVEPVKIIFSLYFGGGLINSFKKIIGNKDSDKK